MTGRILLEAEATFGCLLECTLRRRTIRGNVKSRVAGEEEEGVGETDFGRCNEQMFGIEIARDHGSTDSDRLVSRNLFLTNVSRSSPAIGRCIDHWEVHSHT